MPKVKPDMVDLVPVIDLGSAGAVARIDDACRSVGFLSVVGHDVDHGVINRMREATDAFFALPFEEKRRSRPSSPNINRGYAPQGSESLVYSLGVDAAPPDMFEAFNVGPSENIWPAQPPDFRDALVGYFETVRQLAHRMTHLFALALGLNEDFFESRTDHSTDTLRVNHYERRAGDPAPVAGQMRMGAHTDYGIVTLLHADAVPGLQIIGPDGGWHAVLPVAGSFLVNLGDLLAQWTNDRWRSTLHRVVPPIGPSAAAVRRSVAFFHDGNHDALVECLPTCQSTDNPPRYPPVLAGEHLRAKLLGPRTLTPSDATSTVGDRAHE
jgi:isopenicillin N synthase-like dioxygenase